MLQFDYFYTEPQVAVANYLSILKLLFTHPYYSGLSSEGKILYALFLERGMDCQEKDSDNHVYIYFTMEEMVSFLNISKMEIRANLSELEKMNLIERDMEENPSKIYVKNFSSILSQLSEQAQQEATQSNVIPFSTVGGCMYE